MLTAHMSIVLLHKIQYNVNNRIMKGVHIMMQISTMQKPTLAGSNVKWIIINLFDQPGLYHMQILAACRLTQAFSTRIKTAVTDQLKRD